MKHSHRQFYLLLIFIGFVAMSCTTTKCKSIDDAGKVIEHDTTSKSGPNTANTTPPPPAPPPTDNSPTLAPPTPALAPQVTAAAPLDTEIVSVYKYDNSKQCTQGKEISIDTMAKQLTGIKIISQAKKNDGMIRIQMCGAPTGMANVYQISIKDLKKAGKLGFREWKYTQ